MTEVTTSTDAPVPLQRITRLVLIGIGLGLLAFILVTLLGDVRRLIDTAREFPWLLMLPVLALRVGNWTLRGYRFHWYLRLVGDKTIKPRESALVFVAGMPLGASPGKVAEVLESVFVKNLSGAPLPVTLPLVAAQRLTDGAAVLLLLAWAILALGEGRYWPVAVGFFALIIAGVVILQIRPLCMAILKRMAKLPLIGRFATSFEAFYESSYRIVQFPALIFAVGIGLVANLLDAIGTSLILYGLGQPLDANTFYHALLAMSLSVVTGSLSGSPSGAGASDLTILGALSLFLGNEGQAAFATILARFVQAWFGVTVGGVVLLINQHRLLRPHQP